MPKIRWTRVLVVAGLPLSVAGAAVALYYNGRVGQLCVGFSTIPCNEAMAGRTMGELAFGIGAILLLGAAAMGRALRFFVYADPEKAGAEEPSKKLPRHCPECGGKVDGPFCAHCGAKIG